MEENYVNIFLTSPAFDGLTLKQQFAKFGEVASDLADAAAFARIGCYEKAEEDFSAAADKILTLKCRALAELELAVREYIAGLKNGTIPAENIHY